jgi:hypothetical protein
MLKYKIMQLEATPPLYLIHDRHVNYQVEARVAALDIGSWDGKGKVKEKLSL